MHAQIVILVNCYSDEAIVANVWGKNGNFGLRFLKFLLVKSWQGIINILLNQAVVFRGNLEDQFLCRLKRHQFAMNKVAALTTPTFSLF